MFSTASPGALPCFAPLRDAHMLSTTLPSASLVLYHRLCTQPLNPYILCFVPPHPVHPFDSTVRPFTLSCTSLHICVLYLLSIPSSFPRSYHAPRSVWMVRYIIVQLPKIVLHLSSCQSSHSTHHCSVLASLSIIVLLLLVPNIRIRCHVIKSSSLISFGVARIDEMCLWLLCITPLEAGAILWVGCA